jgi:hypothetical protein
MSRWMDGRATLAMVKSSTTMTCAIARDSSNANPGCGAPDGSPVRLVSASASPAVCPAGT